MLHIGVLEAVVLLWAAYLLPGQAPCVSHLLEFTDNSGAEWAARRETPQSHLLQAVMAKRQEALLESGVFARVERVPSLQNEWADWLSRGKLADVLAAASARGLTPRKLDVSAWRDTSWLRALA